jgi:hypothetical protein
LEPIDHFQKPGSTVMHGASRPTGANKIITGSYQGMLRMCAVLPEKAVHVCAVQAE